MSPEVRHAWLTAGDWVVANWPNLAIAAGLSVFAWWAIQRGIRRPDYRTRNDRAAAQRPFYTDPPNRETAPGSNSDDLLTCHQILNATEARKEKPQP